MNDSRNDYGADRTTTEPLRKTRSLKHVARDEAGVLRASTIAPGVCGCCGRMTISFLDERGAIFAWIGCDAAQARGMSAALADLAAESESLGGGRTRRH